MSETGAFLNALRFMTRLPLPSSGRLDDDWLAGAARYFPAAGIVVGLLTALVFVVAGRFWPAPIPAILAVATSVLFTGALHEDGLADTADGLGGGASPEARLGIMKDSRIGTYGVLALGFSLLLRIAPLAALSSWIAAAALLAAHACARAAPVFVMAVLPYAGDRSASRIAHASRALDGSDIGVALLISALALVPLVSMAATALLVALIVASICAVFVAMRAQRLIGGYTGDILGAVEQAFEIGFLLGVAAMS